jgi:hypothetical protein
MPSVTAEMPVDIAKMPIGIAKMPVDTAKMPIDIVIMSIDIIIMPIGTFIISGVIMAFLLAGAQIRPKSRQFRVRPIFSRSHYKNTREF